MEQNIIFKYRNLKEKITLQNNEIITLNDSIKKLNLRLKNVNNLVSDKKSILSKYLKENIKRKKTAQLLMS